MIRMKSLWKIALALVVLTLANPAYPATITVDGDKSDWAGIAPLINDQVGELLSYEDLVAVSVTNDQTHAYFLLEYANPVRQFGRRIGNYFLFLDTDLDPSTGCDLFTPGELGFEYGFTFSQNIGKDFVGDARNCNVSLPGDEFPDVLTVGNVDNITFIEFSIPIETLRILTPDTTGFRILTTNDRSTLAVYLLQFTQTVAIDIKPGSDNNSINLSSAGVIPVAILGSETFDATTVDEETIFLAGASVKLAGLSGEFSCQERDVNNDDYADLVCDVETAEFMIETGDDTVQLTAETFDGLAIKGTDSIRIVPD